MTQQSDNTNERRLDEELEALGQQLGFSLASSADTSSDDDGEALRVACVFHKNDTALWRLVTRHLSLIRIPGRALRWMPFRLTQEPPHYIQRRLIEQMPQMHLLILGLSIDLVETVEQHTELCEALGAPESPILLPIALRPVHWIPPFITLDPEPKLPMTLWRNSDAAHATIAKTVFQILCGIKFCMESDVEDDPGEDKARHT